MKNLRESGRTVMTDYFPVIEAANNREKAIFEYIKLIVLRNLPVKIVEDPMFRDFCKFDEKLFVKTLKETLFA